jgi:deoxyribodipyrimidine photo-lyase
MGTQLVWFKKDLRVNDHAPLTAACAHGPVVCVYVVEPEIIFSEEFDSSHQVFINECLEELHERLLKLGSGLVILVADLPQAFERLRKQLSFEKIWCHEETGNGITYQRDIHVQSWCKQNGIGYKEIAQSGVIRRLSQRADWKQKWFERMRSSPLEIPGEAISPPLSELLVPDVSKDAGGLSITHLDGFGKIPTLEQLGLPASTKPSAQSGGEGNAYLELASFVFNRSPGYRYELSSPVTGQSSCSRLSPFLTFGAISIRTVYRASVMRRLQLAEESESKSWRKSLLAFEQRLMWHCHYMQSLEDIPAMEFENVDRSYDGLRENEFNEHYFEAWCDGLTGYPMIDACMRYVKETGWLNYRMRAMLVSFATFNLWLHWRRPAIFLAKHFLDFEPGIHYAQFQMHAGTTPERAMLVYTPSKQAYDQDPTGEFIRKYVPELSDVPIEFLHQPHLMPPLFQQFHGCVIGQDYPAPIVGEAESARTAKARLVEWRKRVAAKRVVS